VRERTAADDEVPVVLMTSLDRFKCEVIVARLRTLGIEASIPTPSIRGGRYPQDFRVFVRRGDLARAAAEIDPADIDQGLPVPRSRVGRWFWTLFGGTTPPPPEG
jgi:hypothetical protein